MAKPEWGTKRTCGSCGARFYDMRRQPIVCPKCGAAYVEEAAVRSRRVKPAPVPEKKPKAAPVVADETDLDEADPLEDEGLDNTDLDDDDENKSDDMIEDASDLGEDDEDMAEVIEHLDSDKTDE
ncbi:TIGR02300 family protein [Rhodospira trueperi]|uniref:TIGR02300 family protein n=1 Tax=Rhodospira trueperi TaxID=69960 RepID=A0A1G6Z0C0_9PROT|nr:TIGR02300 family protein [Rhodospira trueperi]SDD96048.1 TIGR02300 family protein [Rhodospira trueperi]